MTLLKRTNVLSAFTCLADKCEDTCCKSWSMQVDENTHQLYQSQAPALLDAIEPSEESPWIMRKHRATGICIKLEGGLCGIHRDYGDDFLTDACHFYPRVTRRLGDEVIMTASMSCPEITRLALYGETPCATHAHEEERLPFHMKDYLPPEMSSQQALAIHAAFIDATRNDSGSAEQIFLRIASASRSLERIERKRWPVMAAFYLQNADSRIPPAEKNIADPFNLLHALCGLIVATHRHPSPRLQQVIDVMEAGLAATLEWDTVRIRTSDNSVASYTKVLQLWQQEGNALFAPALRRYLEMEMSLALYPFSGLGHSLSERVTIIGVRLAIIKLALMCNFSMLAGEDIQDMVVRVIQSLSRFLDHLGDPAFSLKMFEETGWVREGRMRGLLVA